MADFANEVADRPNRSKCVHVSNRCGGAQAQRTTAALYGTAHDPSTSRRKGAEASMEYGEALKVNPHIKFHNSQRGYVRCRVNEKLWHTDFRVAPYVTRPSAPVLTKAGRPGAVRA